MNARRLILTPVLTQISPFLRVGVEHGVENRDQVWREPGGDWIVCSCNLAEEGWQIGLIKGKCTSHDDIQQHSCRI